MFGKVDKDTWSLGSGYKAEQKRYVHHDLCLFEVKVSFCNILTLHSLIPSLTKALWHCSMLSLHLFFVP